jgi:lysophospholipase L1-like esterase
MTADISLIRKIVSGAADVRIEAEKIEFYRMTAAQMNAYRDNADFFTKSRASSGIKFDFMTDAERIVLSGIFYPGSSRSYAFFDVKINGILKLHEGQPDIKSAPSFDITLELDGKENHVEIYFPCLVRTVLEKFELQNYTKVIPVEKKRNILCFGDSITQGYDAIYPTSAYPNQLADELDAVVSNRAVGGEIFNPALLTERDSFSPDLITVAYGTNDWSKITRQELQDNAAEFFRRLTTLYPQTPVFALLPIWRKDNGRVTDAGTFEEAAEIIRKICASHPSVRIIEGTPLVPHLASCFYDGYLHPNDFGFQFMGRNLLKQIHFSS